MELESLPTYKVTLTGSALVGKSSLVARLSGQHVVPTISDGPVQIREQTVTIEQQAIRLTIWDTPGEGRFRQMEERFFANAYAAALVYDVASPSTFFDLMYWRDEIALSFPHLPLLLIGNKIDRGSIVPPEEARGWAESLGMSFVLTSAATGEGVAEAFSTLARLVVQERERRAAYEQFLRTRRPG